MQTFLPFPDFARSAAALDARRLGKQRVETLQILRALHLPDYGWANHPAVAMWRGYTPALVAYGVAVVRAWTQAGRADTTGALIAEFVHPDPPRRQRELRRTEALPPWLGDDDVHRSHRSALLRKDPSHYGRLFPETPSDLPYVWPPAPTPPRAPGVPVATVVRGGAGDRTVVLPAPADEPRADAVARGRGGARRRELARFARELTVGDAVAVPDGDRLRLGLVTGGYRRHADGHVRAVRWTDGIDRADLRFPAALQHPRQVFPLFDEPLVVERLAATPPRRPPGRRGGTDRPAPLP